jgi:fructose-1,6-bisphosphatase/sedoheptulose 1,7-bisphosphatase-like protein
MNVMPRCGWSLSRTRRRSETAQEPRKDYVKHWDSDEDGEIVLVIQAARRIRSQEQILVHYNPGAGIGTWAEVFQCRCCQCRGACVPAENGTWREKDSFKQRIQQVHHAGQEFDDDIRVGDFVQTRNSIFAGCDVTA